MGADIWLLSATWKATLSGDRSAVLLRIVNVTQSYAKSKDLFWNSCKFLNDNSDVVEAKKYASLLP
jgi:hypothetical protein